VDQSTAWLWWTSLPGAEQSQILSDAGWRADRAVTPLDAHLLSMYVRDVAEFKSRVGPTPWSGRRYVVVIEIGGPHVLDADTGTSVSLVPSLEEAAVLRCGLH